MTLLHHQRIISKSLVQHQCIISASSANHQCTISASSVHHQRTRPDQTRPGQKRLQSRGPDSRTCVLVTNMRLMVPKSATGGLHKNSRLRQIKGLSPARRPSSTTPFLSQREDWLENHVLLAARKGSKKAAADSESFYICILEIPRWLASGRGAEQLFCFRETDNWSVPGWLEMPSRHGL